MKRLMLLILVGLAVTMIVGCGDEAADPKNVVSKVRGGIIDYGNGVYYFPFVKSDFANALSGFIKEHPELCVTTMTGNGTGPSEGMDRGYFVVCRKIDIPESSDPRAHRSDR